MLRLLQCLDWESSSGESPIPYIRSIGQFLLSRLFSLTSSVLRSGFSWVSSVVWCSLHFKWMTSCTYDMPRSACSVALETHHGASTIILRILDWLLLDYWYIGWEYVDLYIIILLSSLWHSAQVVEQRERLFQTHCSVVPLKFLFTHCVNSPTLAPTVGKGSGAGNSPLLALGHQAAGTMTCAWREAPTHISLCCAQLCTVKPRFTNASDHEQFSLRTNFPKTKGLEWRTLFRFTNTQAVSIVER
jgi:hypothetical protein